MRLCHGIWDDFPHNNVWYELASSIINHTAAFEAYKRQLAEESMFGRRPLVHRRRSLWNK